VYVVPDETKPTELEPARVGVITLVATETTSAVVSELRRHAMHVEVATAEILHAPPALPVYVISIDRPIAGELADKLVAWAVGSELRPGLIAVIERGGVDECELLLAAGFDDAVVPPISTRELAGRVRAVLRRVHWKGVIDGRMRFADMTLDLYGRSLWIEGKSIPLTSIELAVMRELIKARGRPLSRAELLDAAWGEGDLEVSERAVDNVILRLRRKLPRPELIETVRSVGFRLGGGRPM